MRAPRIDSAPERRGTLSVRLARHCMLKRAIAMPEALLAVSALLPAPPLPIRCASRWCEP